MPTHAHNPQAQQMADESMVRNLAAQAEAIWPQERPFFERYGLDARARILDLACGTGEIVQRLQGLFEEAEVVGVDLDLAHLQRARAGTEFARERTSLVAGDAFALPFAPGAFDLSVVRHFLQAVPDAARVLAELVRVTRSGGRLHVLAEDYGMMHFHPVDVDTDRFWRMGPITFAQRTGTDLRSGRKVFTYLSRMGLRELRVDYITVDTVRAPREVFDRIWSAWRDGYAEAIARETDLTLAEVHASFEAMLAAIRDPDGYGVWQLPLISGVVP